MIEHVVARSLPLVPRAVVQRFARRYVAGETIEHAVRAIEQINRDGARATVDFLGEDVTDLSRAEANVTQYSRLLEQIGVHSLQSNISLKLTALGLKIDETICQRNLFQIAVHARGLGNAVRIDMEDHSCTDATLRIYRTLQPQLGNLGLVLQAMLHRTPGDIALLAAQRPNVRLCKGIYREPAEIAHQRDRSVRKAFVSCLRQLLRARCFVGIATHDNDLIKASLALIEELGVARDGYEFQTLLGVRPELRKRLLQEGHGLRVYVPYGSDWYAYSLRRLRENPKVARHILRAVVLRR